MAYLSPRLRLRPNSATIPPTEALAREDGGFYPNWRGKITDTRKDAGAAKPEYGRGKRGRVEWGGPLRLPWELAMYR